MKQRYVFLTPSEFGFSLLVQKIIVQNKLNWNTSLENKDFKRFILFGDASAGLFCVSC